MKVGDRFLSNLSSHSIRYVMTDTEKFRNKRKEMVKREKEKEVGKNASRETR